MTGIDALQIKVQRPFRNGYNFLFGYNYRREQVEGYYDELDAFNNKFTWLEGGIPCRLLGIQV